MATIKRIQAPIRNPLTEENLRSAVRGNKQVLMVFPGSNEAINIGQQVGATLADPLGFKAAIDGYKAEITQGIPSFLVGAAVLLVGLMLIWVGLNAVVIPAAGKAAAVAAKVVA